MKIVKKVLEFLLLLAMSPLVLVIVGFAGMFAITKWILEED